MSIGEILTAVQYVVNHEGQKTAVQLDLASWEALRLLLEDLEDSVDIKQARQEDDDLFPWEDVVADYHARHTLKSDV